MTINPVNDIREAQRNGRTRTWSFLERMTARGAAGVIDAAGIAPVRTPALKACAQLRCRAVSSGHALNMIQK